ncbi:MAG: hypothetical protein COV71_00870, partial [Candidatus Omnitrophica bacterium CG11_big_fil_rev_8_21_14_0_20_41_12]
MFLNRLLLATFTVSLLAHGVVLLRSPDLNPFTPAPKKQEIRVRYVQQNPQANPLLRNPADRNQKQPIKRADPFLKLDSKIITGNRVPPPYREPGRSYQGQGVLPNKPPGILKPTFASSDLIAIKRK